MCVVLAALAGWGAGVASADVTLEADTYVRSDTPSTNYGTTKEIRARGGGSLVINGLIRFRVQGVGAVGTAKLRVYVTDSSVGTGSVFKVLDNSWVENTIVWPGPAPTGSALDSEPAGPSTGSWVEYDVSSFVTGDGTYSFQIQNSVSDAVYYSSREGSNAPQLVLTTGGGTGTAPANQTAPSISGTTQVGQTLHADPGQWTGTGPITYGYQWQQCTSGTCTPISNAMQQDYTLSGVDEGTTIRVRVTATGAVAPPGVAISSEVGPVTAAQQTAPTNTQPPAITGTPQQGQTLHASPGQWSGTGPITFAYQWRRCSGPTCTDISNPNPNPQDYLLVSDDVNRTIKVTVTATGAVAPPGMATSAAVGPVAPFNAGAGVTLMTAGDIACDPTSSSFNGGNGTSSKCRQKATSDLLLAGNPDAVLPLGDLQYENAKLSDFQASYDISWGRSPLAGKTYPVVGNHEYQTSGATGYYQYWQQKTGQDTAHQATKGYYSFDLGTWHVIVLNSNCSSAGGCGTTSPQGQWLRADLQSHADRMHDRSLAPSPVQRHEQWHGQDEQRVQAALGPALPVRRRGRLQRPRPSLRALRPADARWGVDRPPAFASSSSGQAGSRRAAPHRRWGTSRRSRKRTASSS